MVDQYKNQVNGIMSREVSRVDFLKYIGVAFLGIIGIVGFIKNLHEVVPAHASEKSHRSSGYGGSSYGR